jgi:hypothetical protein
MPPRLVNSLLDPCSPHGVHSKNRDIFNDIRELNRAIRVSARTSRSMLSVEKRCLLLDATARVDREH